MKYIIHRNILHLSIIFLLCSVLLVGCVPPLPSEDYIDKGFEYQVAGQYDQAIAEYTAAIELHPRPVILAHAHSMRASAYMLMKDYERGLEDANISIELDPTIASTYMGRGYILLELGRWEHALVDFDKAIELDDTLASAYLGRATAHVRLEHLDLALEDYRETIKLAPDQPDAEMIDASITSLETRLEQ